jgi:hypothetical protein
MQVVFDMKILRTLQNCYICLTPMTLAVSHHQIQRGLLLEVYLRRNNCPRIGSILHQSRITYGEFIKILAYFSKGNTAKTAAQQVNIAENTVQRFFNMIHERIADDVTTETKIGGVGTVVEVDQSTISVNLTV